MSVKNGKKYLEEYIMHPFVEPKISISYKLSNAMMLKKAKGYTQSFIYFIKRKCSILIKCKLRLFFYLLFIHHRFNS